MNGKAIETLDCQSISTTGGLVVDDDGPIITTSMEY